MVVTSVGKQERYLGREAVCTSEQSRVSSRAAHWLPCSPGHSWRGEKVPGTLGGPTTCPGRGLRSWMVVAGLGKGTAAENTSV